MQYQEALKKVRSAKSRDNFLLIKLAWDKKIILPYAAGITLLSTLQQAEVFDDPYSKTPTIKGPDKDAFETSVMSCDYYEDVKVAALLNVTLEELQKSKIPTTETQ